MILIDTSVWIDHVRTGNSTLVRLLETGEVLAHPFVIGELALGDLRQRGLISNIMRDLPQAVVASNAEVLLFIDRHRLFGCGIGYVDAHLLASVLLAAGATLWTRDNRLLDAARRLAVAANIER